MGDMSQSHQRTGSTSFTIGHQPTVASLRNSCSADASGGAGNARAILCECHQPVRQQQFPAHRIPATTTQSVHVPDNNVKISNNIRHHGTTAAPRIDRRGVVDGGGKGEQILCSRAGVPRATRGGGGGSSMSSAPPDGPPCVLYAEDRGIATITLNRPKVKNAVNDAVFLGMADMLHRAAGSEPVVAVVLTGTGDYFTSGADVKELAGSTEDGRVPSIDKPVGRFMVTLLNFPKLVVAAVNGPAVGVGVTLLPHCDITFAYGGAGLTGGADARPGGAATFWTPFFRLAIVPEFCSSVLFPEILGWAVANDMLVMGRKLSAAEALNAGLVSRVVTADTRENFLSQVKAVVRESVLEQYMAGESCETFKSMMGRDRRPRLMKVLKMELVELDRRMKAGRPTEALIQLAEKAAKAGRSKL